MENTSNFFCIGLKKWSVILLVTFGLFNYGCGDSACQKIDHDSIGRVECSGGCPSESKPNCYVKVRTEGSTEDWEKSGQSTMDKTPGMEYACYCDQ